MRLRIAQPFKRILYARADVKPADRVRRQTERRPVVAHEQEVIVGETDDRCWPAGQPVKVGTLLRLRDVTEIPLEGVPGVEANPTVSSVVKPYAEMKSRKFG